MSGMAANEMLKAIGIPHVNWHNYDNAPADFWDDRGTHYNFETSWKKLNSCRTKK